MQEPLFKYSGSSWAITTSSEGVFAHTSQVLCQVPCKTGIYGPGSQVHEDDLPMIREIPRSKRPHAPGCHERFIETSERLVRLILRRMKLIFVVLK
jgi:hypothetical protein